MVNEFKNLDKIILDIYESTWEHKRYTAARMVWPRRHERNSEGVNWVDWWQDRFGRGQSYAEYVDERRKNPKVD